MQSILNFYNHWPKTVRRCGECGERGERGVCGRLDLTVPAHRMVCRQETNIHLRQMRATAARKN